MHRLPAACRLGSVRRSERQYEDRCNGVRMHVSATAYSSVQRRAVDLGGSVHLRRCGRGVPAGICAVYVTAGVRSSCAAAAGKLVRVGARRRRDSARQHGLRLGRSRAGGSRAACGSRSVPSGVSWAQRARQRRAEVRRREGVRLPSWAWQRKSVSWLLRGVRVRGTLSPGRRRAGRCGNIRRCSGAWLGRARQRQRWARSAGGSVMDISCIWNMPLRDRNSGIAIAYSELTLRSLIRNRSTWKFPGLWLLFFVPLIILKNNTCPEDMRFVEK